MAAIDTAARDLARTADHVRDGARDTLERVTTDAAAALRRATPPYAYRYATRIADTARATKPRAQAAGDRFTAAVRVGGRRAVFRGGASVSQLLWGAEYGAKGGDLVRVRLSTGRTQSVDVARFAAYRRRTEAQWVGPRGRRTVKAGTPGASRVRVTGVRRGGLRQFPARQRDGWFLTPALDAAEPDTWRATDRAFLAALERKG